MTYVYEVELRHEKNGFHKRTEVEASDVWRAVEGAFEWLDENGYNSDDFSVIELQRGQALKDVSTS